MSNFSTWLLAIFMVMFWLFRAIVALCTQYSIDLLGITAYDINMEVIIAFATLPCIVLVVKRKLVGSLFYLAIYAIYFGEHLFTNLVPILQGQATLTSGISMNLLCDMIAILLALFVLMDMMNGRIKTIKDTIRNDCKMVFYSDGRIEYLDRGN